VIIKGGSRSNGRFFAHHLLNGKDNERVRVVEVRGFNNGNVRSAFCDMEAVAKGTNCENFFYHADMNPREGERLTDEQWTRAGDILEKELGFEGQPRVFIEHEKKGRQHRHMVWQRIDPDTMTARPDSLTYRKHEAAAREIEQACALQPVASVLVRDRGTPRPERRAKDWEGFRGVQTGIKPDDVKAEVTALWRQSRNGAEFRTALAQNDYLLCKGDRRDYCIIDREGNDHSLTRRISGAKAAEVRSRLSDIDRESLPTVDDARAERRGEKQQVIEAVERGADKAAIKRVLNAGRAADAAPAPQEDEGDSVPARDIYDRTFTRRRDQGHKQEAPPREPAPGGLRPSWQDRHTRERSREPER
jgi:hypothetical protein